MRNDNKEITGRLYGIGIGPGDPKLLTLRAKEILDRADTIFVPKAKKEAGSCARSIIEAAVRGEKKFIELVFPMTKDKYKLKAYWAKAAAKIAKVLTKEKEAAFVTLGDPFIYSTYTYLLETLRKNFPKLAIETIPGISAFGAAASSVGMPLVKGNESMAVFPVTGNIKKLKGIFKEFDTVVLMKIGSRLNELMRLLEKLKLIKNSVLISRAGQPNEKIIRDISSIENNKLGYLSVIIVRRKK